jgi:putative restriction endonuclease
MINNVIDIEDELIRQAAFSHLDDLLSRFSTLSHLQIAEGFQYHGKRIPFINPQRGIFKPQSMKFLLSIRTVFPSNGKRVWYDDQREVHQQIYANEEKIDYSFMGDNPQSADNQWLKIAFENQIPIIYFLGIAPQQYCPCYPTYIAGWDAENLKAEVVFGIEGTLSKSLPSVGTERRYALSMVKQRLHQSTFRAALLQAYGGRCAFSGLPETRLLDAAHIISDKDQALGQPIITNGVLLSKIHHAAFDAHLIGLDPDFKLHVSDYLLSQQDGPMLEALK